jgi:hypothetical protein
MAEPHSKNSYPIALIVDASSSAEHSWDEADSVRETADKIRLLLAERRVKVFALGNPAEIPLDAFKRMGRAGLIGVNFRRCSLIAPIMRQLEALQERHQIIVVGAGEIFDLDDWVDDPWAAGWLLVNTGEKPLQSALSKLPEISSDELGSPDSLQNCISASEPPQEQRPAPEFQKPSHQLRLEVDRTGYPLIFVEPLGVFTHLFPITKPQFERFIIDYADEWYAAILRENPRASYRVQSLERIEPLLITAITVEDGLSFGKWLGREYSLFNAEEWHQCRNWFAAQVSVPDANELGSKLSNDAKAIWRLISDPYRYQGRPPTLAELSLMKGGILEWVVEREGRYCGLGEPESASELHRSTDHVQPIRGRLRNLGLRLRTRVA